MLTRNEMRMAKKAVEVLTNTDYPIQFAVNGIIHDVDSGAFADSEQLIPLMGQAGTVGAVRAMPNWKTDPAIVDHLIAAVQGKMLNRLLIEHAQIDPRSMAPRQIAELLALTDKQQRKILVDICGLIPSEAHWTAQQGFVKF